MLPTIEKIQHNFIKIDINIKLGIWFYNDNPIAFRSDDNIFVSKNITKKQLNKIGYSIFKTSSINALFATQMEHDEFEILLTETFETCNYHTNALKRPTNWSPYLTSMGTP